MYENHWGIKPYEYDDDYLMHYGIKGMKWKNHVKKAKKYLKKGYNKVRDRIVYGPSAYEGVYAWQPAGYQAWKMLANQRARTKRMARKALFRPIWSNEGRHRTNARIAKIYNKMSQDAQNYPKRLNTKKNTQKLQKWADAGGMNKWYIKSVKNKIKKDARYMKNAFEIQQKAMRNLAYDNASKVKKVAGKSVKRIGKMF